MKFSEIRFVIEDARIRALVLADGTWRGRDFDVATPIVVIVSTVFAAHGDTPASWPTVESP